MRQRLTIAIIVAAVCANAGAAAIGGHQYIARKSLFVQPNASAPAPIKDVVVQLGGQVDFDLPRWLIMTIPDSALQTIREHPAVKYLQQVVSGPFVEPTSTATTARRVSTNTRVAANSLPPWTSGTYKYDGAGNIWAIGNDTFTYDSLSRLAAANVKGVSETYTYDAFGNLTQKTTGTLTVGLPTDTATNHLTEQSYDAAGNLIGDSSETNAFDPVNMQREKDIPGASLAELYVYDASDERIGVIQCSGPPASCTDGKETWTFRDESGKVLRQYEGTSVGSSGFSFPNSEGAWAWIEDYVYRDNLLLAAELQPEEGGRRHFHLDHLGTARLVTGSAGQQLAQHDYYPFGVEIPPSFPETSAGYDREEPMRFTGHERDFNVGTTTENSNYNDFMHARATIPQWGRFLSVDPVLDAKRATVNPQAWNRYTYVMNNPVRWTDPRGQCIEDACVLEGLITYEAVVATIAAFGIVANLWHHISLAERPDVVFPGFEPGVAPHGFDWQGQGPRGSRAGSYHNGATGEVWFPDLDNKAHGPHWDYKDESGRWWRVYPDGRKEPKKGDKTKSDDDDDNHAKASIILSPGVGPDYVAPLTVPTANPGAIGPGLPPPNIQENIRP